MIIVLAALLVGAVVAFLLQSIVKPRNYPPGPKWYPLLGCGNLVQNMTRHYGTQWKALSKLSEKYSTQTLGLKLGPDLVIVVFGEKNIKRVFTEKEFEGRPDSFFIRLRCLGKRLGITFTDGPIWKEHRQFTMKHLKNVGFGKTVMEKEIQEETNKLVEILENNNLDVNPHHILAPAVMNILWRYVAGERIQGDRLKYLLELMYIRSKAFSLAGGWLNQMPWCRFLFPELSGYSLIKKINQQLSDLIDEAIQKHMDKTIEEDDFIYSFLKEVEDGAEFYTVDQLKTICLDLFIAGSQTTSNVVEFAILTALTNGHMQDKVYQEISKVIGDATPCWVDCNKMPFTSAFLLEVQRYYTIVPIAGPRRVLADTMLDGYFIPKESTVLIALGQLHFDEKYWKEPNTFMPERFLNEDGTLKNSEHLYQFGYGRRRCPGESLAKSFIFLTFTRIIQKYKIECCNGIMPSAEPVVGLLSSPTPYTADFIQRK